MPKNAKMQSYSAWNTLGLPSQGANNVVHVRAIGGGTSERSCGHELLCRQPVSIPSHIQGDVNVIHKLDCMPL